MVIRTVDLWVVCLTVYPHFTCAHIGSRSYELLILSCLLTAHPRFTCAHLGSRLYELLIFDLFINHAPSFTYAHVDSRCTNCWSSILPRTFIHLCACRFTMYELLLLDCTAHPCSLVACGFILHKLLILDSTTSPRSLVCLLVHVAWIFDLIHMRTLFSHAHFLHALALHLSSAYWHPFWINVYLVTLVYSVLEMHTLLSTGMHIWFALQVILLDWFLLPPQPALSLFYIILCLPVLSTLI